MEVIAQEKEAIERIEMYLSEIETLCAIDNTTSLDSIAGISVFIKDEVERMKSLLRLKEGEIDSENYCT